MGFNSNGTGLFGGGSGGGGGAITGGVNGITAYGADPTKLALGGTMIDDETTIDMGGFQLRWQGPVRIDTLGVNKNVDGTFKADILGRVRQISDGLLALEPLTSGGIIGLSLLTPGPGSVERGFFKMDVNTGDIAIGGGGGGYVPRLVANDLTVFRTNTSGFIGFGASANSDATSRVTIIAATFPEASLLLTYPGDLGSGLKLSYRAIEFPNDGNSAIVFGGGGGIYSTATGSDFIMVSGNAGAPKNFKQLFGDYFFDSVSKGPVIKSPDGTTYRVVAANGGALSTVAT